jgi:hypothetical protein
VLTNAREFTREATRRLKNGGERAKKAAERAKISGAGTGFEGKIYSAERGKILNA